MTTNSPNPVDGDVQVLIADCQAEIAQIEKALTTWGDAWIPSLQSKLKRQQVSLAALTAVPFAYSYQYARCETWDGFKDWNQEFSTEHPPEWMLNTSRVKNLKNLYTTPPAQPLRPVELPDCDYGAVSHMSGGSKDYCNGFVDGTNNAIKAIREAGYEVKND